MFIQFTSITASFANYKHVGLCPTWNNDKSVISTLLIKEIVNKNDSRNRNSLIFRGKKFQERKWRENHPCFWNSEKNQVQETGSDKAAGEVVQEGAVTKDVLGEANASTAQHTHHLSETLI